MYKRLMFLLFLLAVVRVPLAHAQVSASVAGTVTDPS